MHYILVTYAYFDNRSVRYILVTNNYDTKREKQEERTNLCMHQSLNCLRLRRGAMLIRKILLDHYDKTTKTILMILISDGKTTSNAEVDLLLVGVFVEGGGQSEDLDWSSHFDVLEPTDRCHFPLVQ